MKMIRKILAAALMIGSLAVMTANSASAEVILRTGDYRLVQIDTGEDGVAGPRLTRYYHSQWDAEGMFGPGWLSEYEVTVTRGDDDTLLVLDLCTGETIRFVRSGSVEEGDGEEGAVYIGSRCGCQKIVATESGFVRSYCGREETFDQEGRLLRVRQGEDTVEVLRDSGGRIVALTDSRGNRFDLGSEGDRVTSITARSKLLASYGYNSGRLAKVDRSEESALRFGYDDSGLLEEVGTGMRWESLSYLSRGMKPLVASHRSSYGEWEEYHYDEDTRGGLVHSTTVSSGFDDGEAEETTLHLFTEKVDAAGDLWLSQETVVREGEVVSDTLYSATGQVEESTRYGVTTRRSYDSADRLIRREAPDEIVELEYDSANGKVIMVRRSSGDGSLILETIFSYDQKGNLLLARNTDGKRMALAYDASNRIESMDNGAQRLLLSYGSIGKPTRLEIEGVGRINVTYDESGEIKEVQNGKGVQVALQVTNLFSELMEMINEVKLDAE